MKVPNSAYALSPLTMHGLLMLSGVDCTRGEAQGELCLIEKHITDGMLDKDAYIKTDRTGILLQLDLEKRKEVAERVHIRITNQATEWLKNNHDY